MTGTASTCGLSSDRSITMELETIAVIGVSIGVIARELEATEASVRSLRHQLEHAAAGAQLYPGEAIAATRLSTTRCELARDHVSTLAEAARTAAARYAQAERDNVRWTALQRAHSAWSQGLELRFAGPLAPLVAWGQADSFLREAKRDGLRHAGMAAMAQAPGYLAALFGLDLGFVQLVAGWTGAGRTAAPTQPLAAGLRKGLDGVGVFQQGELAMRRVPPEDWAVKYPDGPSGPAGFPGHLGRIDALGGWAAGATAPTYRGVVSGSDDAYGVAPSSIIVREVDRGDGTTLWIVNLPGTEDWSLDSENIWDVEGDLEAMTAAQKGEFKQKNVLVAELVKAALAASGAVAGEDVLLTGHSGGGIHAAAMASDPAFLAEVNVKMAIIAGAPAAGNVPGPGVEVVDFENTNDIVTAAAGGEPAQTENWTTVVSGPRPGADTAGLLSVAKTAHEIGGYLDDAGALDASSDPAYAAPKAKLDALLGPAAVATGVLAYKQYVYEGKDVPKPPPPPRRPEPRPEVRRWQEGR
ncbi:hypothetical protein ACQCSX_13275 [Pseudarthrobacter sp. P1]|uniref:hypothetical protein n=1 Tax=Pseudarthrobacter sp. P1 TaxID=3418418 RepID=UPI003CEAEA06